MQCICLPKTGRVLYTAESPWNGIIPTGTPTYPCQSISKRNCRNTDTSCPKKIQACPYLLESKKLGRRHMPPSSPMQRQNLMLKAINVCRNCQQHFILCTVRAVDMMILMALSSTTVEQTKATGQTMERCTQLLDSLAGHPDAKVRFHASYMIMNVHLGVLYLSEAKACSRACGHFS